MSPAALIVLLFRFWCCQWNCREFFSWDIQWMMLFFQGSGICRNGKTGSAFFRNRVDVILRSRLLIFLCRSFFKIWHIREIQEIANRIVLRFLNQVVHKVAQVISIEGFFKTAIGSRFLDLGFVYLHETTPHQNNRNFCGLRIMLNVVANFIAIAFG